ncbi:MAG: class I SAM-dependent methyltransferase [Flavobacteriales bacterium]|nr:class I SAM-dependent methyltransferase [Flavobacteriales bacterium]MCB9197803.1 class I SAM-dependent methyltransferase [Flavobacteriales bacterium]
MVNTDFDHIAHQYDNDFSNTLIGKAQRNLVWNILKNNIKTFKGLDVLEINCGTGIDAEMLASEGANILATDISSEMINVTKDLISKYTNASTQVLDIRNIHELNTTYDLVFSNFGGLNCLNEQDLLTFVNQSHELLKPNGNLVLVIMPKYTIWESLYFLAKLSPRKAVRRWTKKEVMANVEGRSVATYYHNPNIFNQLNNYAILSVSPVGLFIPPSYLENRFRNRPKKIEKYFQKDLSKTGKKNWAKFADHYCIVLNKK